MEIMELAAELGKKLKEDARLVEFEQAKKAYESDTKLKELMTELNVQQKAMANEMEKAEHDEAFMGLIQKRINELYDSIRNNEAFDNLNRTQSIVNELMNTVNKTIMANLSDEEPVECTHNCATCSGCH